MTVERIDIPALGIPAGPYCHATRFGGALYTSGFTAFGTASQSASISEQADTILDQLELIATSQGSSMEMLAKVTIFITDPAGIPDLRQTLTKRYGSHRPASSMVVVKELFAPDLKVEIEATFAL